MATKEDYLNYYNIQDDPIDTSWGDSEDTVLRDAARTLYEDENGNANYGSMALSLLPSGLGSLATRGLAKVSPRVANTLSRIADIRVGGKKPTFVTSRATERVLPDEAVNTNGLVSVINPQTGLSEFRIFAKNRDDLGRGLELFRTGNGGTVATIPSRQNIIWENDIVSDAIPGVRLGDIANNAVSAVSGGVRLGSMIPQRQVSKESQPSNVNTQMIPIHQREVSTAPPIQVPNVQSTSSPINAVRVDDTTVPTATAPTSRSRLEGRTSIPLGSRGGRISNEGANAYGYNGSTWTRTSTPIRNGKNSIAQDYNNPLNETIGGVIKGDRTDYKHYNTLEDGIRGNMGLLLRYQDRDGLTNLGSILAKWTGAKGDKLSQYVNNVSKWSGLDPNANIDLHDTETAVKLFKAMARAESPMKLSEEQIRNTLTGNTQNQTANTPAVLQNPNLGAMQVATGRRPTQDLNSNLTDFISSLNLSGNDWLNNIANVIKGSARR